MAQVIRKYIELNAVGNDQMLLENDGYIRAVDAAGTGEVNMFKVDANDQIAMAVSLLPAEEDLTLGSSTAPFVDTYSIGTFGKFVSLFEDMATTNTVLLSSSEEFEGNPYVLMEVLNQTTTFGLLIKTGENSENDNSESKQIVIQTGAKSVGTGDSGDIRLRTGDATDDAGDIQLIGGNAADNAGSISLIGGDSSGDNGGEISIRSGFGPTEDDRGIVSFEAKRTAIAAGVFSLLPLADNPTLLTAYSAGDMYYNSDSNVIKYFDGTNWIALGDADAAANKTLSNLEAPVALNQDLKPDSDLGRAIGAADMRFSSVFANEIDGGDGNLNLLADAASNFHITLEGKYIKLEGDYTEVTGPGVSAPGVIRFNDTDNSNYIALQAPAVVAADVTFTLPVADGSAGQVLTTDGAGQLEWSSSQANDAWERETIVVSAGDMANGYIELENEAIANSVIVFADGLAQIEGASYDYTISVVGGLSRITWVNDWASIVAENDVLVVQYQYAQ